MNAHTEPIARKEAGTGTLDLDAVFREQYPRMAGVIRRIVRDPSRAEELAVDVFCKLWKAGDVHPGALHAWLYTTSVRAGLDELRRRNRRQRYERFFRPWRSPRTPDELHSIGEQQRQVRTTLAALKRREAEILVLRNEGLSYEDIAHAIGVRPASVGTLLRRAREAFRNEYRRRYD